jgi:ferredoxin-NADP reductase
MSMLRYRQAVGSHVPATLLYSSRGWDDVIYREELARLASEPGLRIVHTLTRSHPDGWEGYTRRIDTEMLREVCGGAFPGGLAYICGPTRLVESVAADLVSLGYPAEQVKTERFGPTGG